MFLTISAHISVQNFMKVQKRMTFRRSVGRKSPGHDPCEHSQLVHVFVGGRLPGH